MDGLAGTRAMLGVVGKDGVAFRMGFLRGFVGSPTSK